MRLEAEGSDRIIVQNNPVNLIDPFGLDPFRGLQRISAWSPQVRYYEKKFNEGIPQAAEKAVKYGAPVAIGAGVAGIAYEAGPAIVATIYLYPEITIYGIPAIEGLSPGTTPNGPGYISSAIKSGLVIMYQWIRDLWQDDPCK